MNEEEKHSSILKLSSIGRRTAGMYPTLKEFREALKSGRVFGDYEKRVVIIGSDNLHIEYLFVKEKADRQ